MISGRQIRAVRALLGWSAEPLAARSGLSRESIGKIEEGVAQPRPRHLADITRELE